MKISYLPLLVSMALSCAIAQADQLGLSYVDKNSEAQTLVIDCNSSVEDLRLAADLLDEDGVSVTLSEESACSLADIAGALAAASPASAADIAVALVALSPVDRDAIVAAIIAVDGVDQEAVYAALHLGPPGVGLGLTEDEPVASKN